MGRTYRILARLHMVQKMRFLLTKGIFYAINVYNIMEDMPTISMRGSKPPSEQKPVPQAEAVKVTSPEVKKMTMQERLQKQIQARREQAETGSIQFLKNYPDKLKDELDRAKESLMRFTQSPDEPIKNLSTIKLRGLKILDGVYQEQMEEFKGKNLEKVTKELLELEKQKSKILEQKNAIKAPIDEALQRRGASFSDIDANLLGRDRKHDEEKYEAFTKSYLQALQTELAGNMPEVMSMRSAGDIEQALKNRPELIPIVQEMGTLKTALEYEAGYRRQKLNNEVADELNAGGKEMLSPKVLEAMDMLDDQARDVTTKISAIVRPYEARLKGTFPALLRDLLEGRVEFQKGKAN